VLNDKKSEPALIDEASGVRFLIPETEKIGKLRQTPRQLEAGRQYWMVFANPGQTIRRGSHVDVVISKFRADGLVVE